MLALDALGQIPELLLNEFPEAAHDLHGRQPTIQPRAAHHVPPPFASMWHRQGHLVAHGAPGSAVPLQSAWSPWAQKRVMPIYGTSLTSIACRLVPLDRLRQAVIRMGLRGNPLNIESSRMKPETNSRVGRAGAHGAWTT